MIKKILLGLLALIVVGGGAFFFINGKDKYDPSKFSAKISDGLNVGSTVSFTLPDQFDKVHTLDDSTKKLILVFKKDAGHAVNEFLQKQEADYLTKRNTLFIADISPMPVIIRNAFALPDLKSSSYIMLLLYDEAIVKQFKDEANVEKIAIVTLENAVVKSTQFISTEEELKAALN